MSNFCTREILRIDHEDIARPVDRYPDRTEELTVPRTRSTPRRHELSGTVELLDPIVLGIGDENVADPSTATPQTLNSPFPEPSVPHVNTETLPELSNFSIRLFSVSATKTLPEASTVTFEGIQEFPFAEPIVPHVDTKVPELSNFSIRWL